MAAGVNQLLRGELGGQHSYYQADIEIGEEFHQTFFLGQNRGIGDNRSIGDHQKHHIKHEGKCGAVDGITNRELFPLHLGIADPAAGDTDQSSHRNGKNRQEGGLAAHVFLHLESHIGTQGHSNGDGKGKPANALCNLGAGQHVAGQRHGGETTYGIYSAHIQADDNQRAEYGKENKSRERQAEQRQKQQVYPIAVEVVQQISRHWAKEDRRHGHSGQHNADFRPGDSDFLAIDGDGGVKSCQYQQIGNKEENELSASDFFSFSHAYEALLPIKAKYSSACHRISIA